MKHTTPFVVLCIVIISLLAAIAVERVLSYVYVHPSDTTLSTVPISEQQFLKNCSGVTPAASLYTMIYGICHGLIQGVFAGHQLTIGMVNITNKDNKIDIPQLWCGPPQHAGDLVKLALDWIRKNEVEYNTINKRFRGNEAAIAVIFRVLADAYPCVEE